MVNSSATLDSSHSSLKQQYLILGKTQKKKVCGVITMMKDWAITACASSQCYWDELMLLNCQINTNSKKNGFVLSTKYLKRVLTYSYTYILSLKYLNFFIYVCQFYNHFVLIWHFTSISSNFNSISSHFKRILTKTLIALAHLNSTENMHRLHYKTKYHDNPCKKNVFREKNVMGDFLVDVTTSAG